MPYAYGMFYDYYYVVLVLPVIIASLIIQAKLKSTYKKYSQIGNMRSITGAQAARIILDYYGVYQVNIVPCAGNLTDCYDPKANEIRLSEGVFFGSSVAAVGIACHEAGHAAQHAEEYVPIKIRNSFVPVCNIGSKLSIPLLIIGMIFGFTPLVWVGIGFFAFTALFQLLTLPVEFNASSRALKVIEATGLLTYEEKGGAAKVLRAAAMTYVAALATSVVQLIRLILIYGKKRR